MISRYAEAGLIEVKELSDLLTAGQPIKLIDATYPAPRDTTCHECIDNAAFFDIDEIADRSSSLPHMLPSAEVFSQAVSAMGIGNDDLVVVYDQQGIAMAAARVWWMFRVFGHDNVCVLNGGLPAWKAQGFPLQSGLLPPAPPKVFSAVFRTDLVKTLQQAQQAACDDDIAILDARSAVRFAGKSPEPRPGLRPGHIPGSHNLPYADLIDPSSGRLKGKNLLEEVCRSDCFESKKIISTCGSGVTACVIALAYYNMGKKDIAVYDGSWAEWGQEESGTEVATGV